MRTIKLEAFRDESTGELGLGVVGMPRDESTNSATEGLLVAHDLIEHVNGIDQIGGIADELEALGGIWYVRGQHGVLRHDRVGSALSIAQNVSGDIVRMFRDYCYGSYLPMPALRTRPCVLDQDLMDTMEEADQTYLGEFNSDEYEDARSKWPAYRALCLHRMRIGYRKAHRKWEKHGRYAASNQFWAIAEAIDRMIKHIDEGMRYKLTYGRRDGEALAFCDEDYSEDY